MRAKLFPEILTFLLSAGLCVWFAAASAETPAEVLAASSEASSMLAVQAGGRQTGEAVGVSGGTSHAASAQLLSGEVAALLEHLQSQHVYLKHLENVRRALEKELSIVRLMHECDGLGSACTGRGIVAKSAPPAPSSPPPSSPPVASEPAAFEEPAFDEPPLPLREIVYELPVVVGVHRDVASLVYANRRVEARPGTRVGPFTVTAVALDRVRLDGPNGEVSLPLRWTPPALPSGEVLNPASASILNEVSGGALGGASGEAFARPLGAFDEFRGAQ